MIADDFKAIKARMDELAGGAPPKNDFVTFKCAANYSEWTLQALEHRKIPQFIVWAQPQNPESRS